MKKQIQIKPQTLTNLRAAGLALVNVELTVLDDPRHVNLNGRLTMRYGKHHVNLKRRLTISVKLMRSKVNRQLTLTKLTLMEINLNRKVRLTALHASGPYMQADLTCKRTQNQKRSEAKRAEPYMQADLTCKRTQIFFYFVLDFIVI